MPRSPSEGARDENPDMIGEGSEEAYLHYVCMKCPPRWDYGTSRRHDSDRASDDARRPLNGGKSPGG